MCVLKIGKMMPISKKAGLYQNILILNQEKNLIKIGGFMKVLELFILS